jgi:hypothetical protein
LNCILCTLLISNRSSCMGYSCARNTCFFLKEIKFLILPLFRMQVLGTAHIWTRVPREVDSLCEGTGNVTLVWKSGGIAPPFLTSALDGGEWSASRLCRFNPEGNSPWYSLYRSLGAPQRRCGLYGEVTNLLSLSGIELRFLGRPARRYTHWIDLGKVIIPGKRERFNWRNFSSPTLKPVTFLTNQRIYFISWRSSTRLTDQK